jgi:hypothetical protein
MTEKIKQARHRLTGIPPGHASEIILGKHLPTASKDHALLSGRKYIFFLVRPRCRMTKKKRDTVSSDWFRRDGIPPRLAQ